jgi:O-methyltransferase
MNRHLKALVRRTLSRLGLEIRRVAPIDLSVPDRRFYTPLFSPWHGYGDFEPFLRLAEPYSFVSPDRLYVLYAFALNAVRLPGEFWECGVYKGGTARMLAEIVRLKGGQEATLHLFDTFAGMPKTNKLVDFHNQGDFADTSLEAVREAVGDNDRVVFHPGFIPETFAGKERSIIALAHVDLDIHKSILDCSDFIYPRLAVGGVMLFDDYGFPACPGARKAVDDFFSDKPETPVVLPTGQAAMIKLPRSS